MCLVTINKVSKVINDDIILKDITVNIEKSKIYGFIGGNGSGKTMLFKLISGLSKATTGEIYISNKLLGKEIDFPESCGAIIDKPGFWDNYTGFDNLKLIASINNKVSDNEIKNFMRILNLDPDSKILYKKYSLGMKQKLGIIQSMMESPSLIILDEPTNGLDDCSIEIVRKLILDYKIKGSTILIASHNKEDIEMLSDFIFKIDNGLLIKIRG